MKKISKNTLIDEAIDSFMQDIGFEYGENNDCYFMYSDLIEKMFEGKISCKEDMNLDLEFEAKIKTAIRNLIRNFV